MISNIFSTVFFLIFVLSIMIGVYGLRKDNSFRAKLFFMITICISIWAFTFSALIVSVTVEEARFWHRISTLGWCVIYGMMLHFSILTRYGKLGSNSIIKLLIIYLPSVILIYIFGINAEIEAGQYEYIHNTNGWIALSNANLYKTFFILYYGLYSLIAFYNYFMWGKKSKSLSDKKSSLLINGSLIFGVILGSITDIVLNMFLTEKIPSMGPLFVMLPLLAFYHSIKRYNFISSSDSYNDKSESILTLKTSIRFTIYMVIIVALTGWFIFFKALREPSIRFEGFILAGLFIICAALVLNIQNLKIDIKKKEGILVSIMALYLLFTVTAMSLINENNISWAIPMLIIIPASVIANQLLFYTVIGFSGSAVLLYLALSWGKVITVDIEDYIARVVIILFAIFLTYMVSKAWRDKRILNDKSVAFQYLLSEINSEFSDAKNLTVEDSVQASLTRIKNFYNVDNCYLETVNMPGESFDRLLISGFEGYNNPVTDSQNEIVEHMLLSCIKHTNDNIAIDRLLNYDTNTGVYNRAYFVKFFNEFFQNAKSENKYFAVMLVDIDSFKEINDILGYEDGNMVLKTIAEVFTKIMNKRAYIFRFDGDEFLILTKASDSMEEMEELTFTLVGDLINIKNNPLLYKNIEVFTTLSIGVATYPKDANEGELLIKNADMALFSAKIKGKNQASYYSNEMREDTKSKLFMTSALQKAIDKNELYLNFQPQIDINTDKIVGFEALVRWNSTEFGNISPGIFIPLAEQSKLINRIGEFVINESFKQLAMWNDKYDKSYRMAVNLSPRQLYTAGLEDTIKAAIKAYKLEPKYIDFEITEGMMIRDFNFFMEILKNIKETGVEISIDDYGTEYSSLLRLKSLPVDRLKIDLHFIRNLGKSPMSDAVVKSLIHLGKGFGLKVLAEGVEKESQMQFLKDNGCDEYQGYYKSKPLSAAEIDRIYHQNEQEL